MQKFEYRTPRHKVDLPVLLVVADARMPGRCREISNEGMTAEFRGPVAADSSGTISISYKNLELDLPVSVTHNGNGAYGLKFLFETERERTAVERLVALLSGGSSGQAGPVLVR